jgi:hypothetical protein
MTYSLEELCRLATKYALCPEMSEPSLSELKKRFAGFEWCADKATAAAFGYYAAMEEANGRKTVTKDIYDALPKSRYYLSLVAVENEKGLIQVTDKNEKEILASLNKMYTDHKKVNLYFVSAVKLSQQITVRSERLNSNVKITTLVAAIRYEWKSRNWFARYLGRIEMNEYERKQTEKRFAYGLIDFSKENSIKFMQKEVEPE